MTEEDNIHPVVRLLAARMESHPEEFYFRPDAATPDDARWEGIIDWVRRRASSEELSVLNKPYLDAAHEVALEELMNGPERRAEKERLREEDNKRRAEILLRATTGTNAPGYYQNPYATGQNQLRNVSGLASETLPSIYGSLRNCLGK